MLSSELGHVRSMRLSAISVHAAADTGADVVLLPVYAAGQHRHRSLCSRWPRVIVLAIRRRFAEAVLVVVVVAGGQALGTITKRSGGAETAPPASGALSRSRSDYSFPSGHSVAAAAALRRARLPAGALAALSRSAHRGDRGRRGAHRLDRAVARLPRRALAERRAWGVAVGGSVALAVRVGLRASGAQTRPRGHYSARFSDTVKVVPTPTSDATMTVPPLRSTTWRTSASPSPVPPLSRLLCTVDAVEALEDAREVLRGDSGAGVGDHRSELSSRSL